MHFNSISDFVPKKISRTESVLKKKIIPKSPKKFWMKEKSENSITI